MPIQSFKLRWSVRHAVSLWRDEDEEAQLRPLSTRPTVRQNLCILLSGGKACCIIPSTKSEYYPCLCHVAGDCIRRLGRDHPCTTSSLMIITSTTVLWRNGCWPTTPQWTISGIIYVEDVAVMEYPYDVYRHGCIVTESTPKGPVPLPYPCLHYTHIPHQIMWLSMVAAVAMCWLKSVLQDLHWTERPWCCWSGSCNPEHTRLRSVLRGVSRSAHSWARTTG